jgi:hypothetical protein
MEEAQAHHRAALNLNFKSALFCGTARFLAKSWFLESHSLDLMSHLRQNCEFVGQRYFFASF